MHPTPAAPTPPSAGAAAPAEASRGRPLAALLVAASAAVATLAPGCARLYDTRYASAGAEYWFPRLSGDVRLDSGSLSGTTIDVVDDLDIEDEAAPNVRAAVQLGNVTLDASYLQIDYSGDANVDKDITFGGRTFTVGTPVSTNADFRYLSAKAKIGLLGLGPVAVGAIAGVNYIDLKADLDSPLASASETLQAPFPVVGAVATLSQSIWDSVGVFGDVEVSGIAVDAFDVRGHFLEAAVRAGVTLYGTVRAGAGYRYLDLDIEETSEDFRWDFGLGGPFVFAEIAF